MQHLGDAWEGAHGVWNSTLKILSMSKALLLFLFAISSINFNVAIFHLRIQAIDTTFSCDLETVVT